MFVKPRFGHAAVQRHLAALEAALVAIAASATSAPCGRGRPSCRGRCPGRGRRACGSGSPRARARRSWIPIAASRRTPPRACRARPSARAAGRLPARLWPPPGRQPRRLGRPFGRRSSRGPVFFAACRGFLWLLLLDHCLAFDFDTTRCRTLLDHPAHRRRVLALDASGGCAAGPGPRTVAFWSLRRADRAPDQRSVRSCRRLRSASRLPSAPLRLDACAAASRLELRLRRAGRAMPRRRASRFVAASAAARRTSP